jgi:hypothetical protein
MVLEFKMGKRYRITTETETYVGTVVDRGNNIVYIADDATGARLGIHASMVVKAEPAPTEFDALAALLGWRPGADIAGTLDAPEFAKATRVHDWRNHVPEAVQAVWGTLSRDVRLAVLVMAEHAAGQEDWD